MAKTRKCLWCQAPCSEKRGWCRAACKTAHLASKKCETCGGQVPFRSGRVQEWHGRRFCSHACSNELRREEGRQKRRRSKPCPQCGHEFSPRPNQPIKDFLGQRFCSRECATKDKTGKIICPAEEPRRKEGLPTFQTEPERAAFMRGIWVGWERGLASNMQHGDMTGNVLMSLVSEALRVSKTPKEIRAKVYAAASTLPIPKVGKVAPRMMLDAPLPLHNRLSREQVLEIREAYTAGGSSQRELGEKYGVSVSTIGNIVRGKSWKDI